jgi:hypothetical protein
MYVNYPRKAGYPEKGKSGLERGKEKPACKGIGAHFPTLHMAK